MMKKRACAHGDSRHREPPLLIPARDAALLHGLLLCTITICQMPVKHLILVWWFRSFLVPRGESFGKLLTQNHTRIIELLVSLRIRSSPPGGAASSSELRIRDTRKQNQ